MHLCTLYAQIDFCKPQKNNERCYMIKINCTVCCSALKYLQGVNIYQRSVEGHGIFPIKSPLEHISL